MKTYILKRDLPWAKAGTEWVEFPEYFRLSDNSGAHPWLMKSEMHFGFERDWFEEKKSERWRPNRVPFFIVNGYGLVQRMDENAGPRLLYEFGNCFRTKEQAEEAARRVKECLLNFHSELYGTEKRGNC